MDELALLAEARASGLTVRVAGDKLVIRGPRRAAALAQRLLAHKTDIMVALSGPSGSELREDNAELNRSSESHIGRDLWGFPLAAGEQAIDWRSCAINQRLKSC